MSNKDKEELRVRRLAQHNMKFDEAMVLIVRSGGRISAEALGEGLKITLKQSEALIIVLNMAGLVEGVEGWRDN